MLTILLTGAGGGGSNNLMRALKASGRDLRLVGTNSNTFALARSLAASRSWPRWRHEARRLRHVARCDVDEQPPRRALLEPEQALAERIADSGDRLLACHGGLGSGTGDASGALLAWSPEASCFSPLRSFFTTLMMAAMMASGFGGQPGT